MWLVGVSSVFFGAAASLGFGAEESVEFDAKPILEHNKAWLHPDLRHVESVSFDHVVEPVTIKERFAWRADGSSFVEVLQRELVAEAVGKLSVTTSEPALHYFAPGSDYAELQAAPDQGFKRLLRDYLMGTRANVVALDWGWDPEQFTVRDVLQNDEGQLVVQLVPHALEYHINAGAMFHARSSAYVSKCRIGWGELTIDPESRRILREVDYSVKGERSCEIEFSDWKAIESGQEVPLRIHLQLAHRNGVDVDYRFQWKDEGLWILATGQTQFKDKDPTRQEIQDLRINQPELVLDEMLARVEESTARQQLPVTEPERTQLTGLHRFEFGTRAEPVDTEAASPVRSVLFTYDDSTSTRSKWPPVVAEIEVAGPAPAAGSGVELQLTFLDKQGQPLFAQRTPLAAVLNSDRTLGELGTSVAERNAVWLSLDEEPPELTYTFSSGEESLEFSVDESTTDIALRRGINLYGDWSTLAHAPDTYHAPVQFSGILGGKQVVVSTLIESVRSQWNNGLKRFGRVGGYHSSYAPYGLLIVEKDTSRPILSRYDEVEIYYLDYVELESGGSAPLRIAIFQGERYHDFRFQIVNGRWWLFDRSYWNGGLTSRIENVSIDGETAEITARCPEDTALADQLPRLDWSQITDRKSTRGDEPQLVRDIIAQSHPWEHPSYESLLKSKIVVNESAQQPTLTLHIDQFSFCKEIGYWWLAWFEPNAPPQHFVGPEAVEVRSYPLNLDEPIVVNDLPMAGSSGWSADRTRLRSCRLGREDANWLAELEVVSHDRMVGVLAPVAVALVGEDGRIQAAVSEDVAFTIHDGIYATEASIPLGHVAVEPEHVLLGLKAKVTSAPSGSLWASYMDRGPAFSHEQLLAADDSRVWGRAARWLYGELRENGLDRGGLERTWRDRSSTRTDLLKPHLDQFERLLLRTESAEPLCFVARLAGHSGDPRFEAPLAALLEHEMVDVCDAAAIGLGLLGDPRGVGRLPSVLRRPMPEDKEDWFARQAVESWQTDAALALAVIATDEALGILRDALLNTAAKLHEEPAGDSAKLTGPVAATEIFIHVLGRTKSPIAFEAFRKALALPVGGRLGRQILPHLSRWEDKDAIRDVFVDGIRRGDPAFIDDAPRDPAITEAMVEALTQLDLSDGAAWHAVRHLGFAPEPAALQALIEVYEKRRFYESNRVRLELIEMLADRKGDYRGLTEVLDRLCVAVDGSALPEDPEALAKEKKKRDDQVDDLLDLVTGEFPVDVVVKFLRRHVDSEDGNMQQAVELILAESGSIRTAISTPPVVFPDSVELLSHVDETAAGRQSYGGRGFAVKFTRPEAADHVFAVEFHGSRYGHAQAPAEDFHIYLLDEDQKLIQDTPIPYSRVQHGNEKWYRFILPPVEMPREFFVGLWFNAHQTKGVLVGKNRAGETGYSYTGTLEKGFGPVTDEAEWMIRVRVAPKDVAGRLAVDLAPKPSQPSIPAPLLAPEEDQAKARQILKQVAEVNRYWLFGPPPAVKEFSYEFRFGNDKPTAFEVDTKTSGGGSTRQGISYYSPLHRLASDPSQVSFRRVDVGPEKVTLAYMLPEPMRVAMGTGVSGSWRGYFSTSVREGTLVVDAARLVPLEHTTADLQETWSEYAPQAPDHLAPRTIDIRRKGTQIHWKFQLWEPGLWLFSSAGESDPKDEEPPLAAVDGVHVNGEKARMMDANSAK
jgi:HEAT repeat protein